MQVSQEYSDFVSSRFKFLPDPGLGGDPTSGLYITSANSLMHAAVGMVGEVIELLQAEDRANAQEELGDFEFYLQAAKIVTAFSDLDGPGTYDLPEIGVGTWGVMGLLVMSGEFLDLTKKEWVYNAARARPHLHALIWQMGEQLATLYEFFGLSRDDVLAANIGKLLKRFPTGYSDADAQARADKVAADFDKKAETPVYHPLTAGDNLLDLDSSAPIAVPTPAPTPPEWSMPFDDIPAHVWSTMTPADKLVVQGIESPDQMITFHHTVGMAIRNKYGFWNTNSGISDPDAASATILERIWALAHPDALPLA